MKGYKIDLSEHIIPGSEEVIRTDEKNQPILNDAGEEQKGIIYNIRQSIIQVFTSAPTNGRAALLAMKLANRIEDCKEDYIILDTVEYQSLKVAFENFDQFRPMNDGELIGRVLEAKFVELDVKV